MAPADYGPHLHSVDWTLILFSLLFLSLRIYCKIWRHRGLWYDDHILALSWLSLLVEVIFTTLRIRLGFGKHAAQIPRGNIESITLLGKVSSTFSIGAIVLSKVSFSLTLLRITARSSWMRRIVWGLMGSMVMAMTLNLVTIWLKCPDERCESGSLVYNIFSSGEYISPF